MTRSLTAGQVSVAGNESEVELGSGRGQFRVKALAPDDYPSLPIEDQASDSTGIESEIAADILGVALSQVVRSASGDESRQILTGVLWELSQDSLTLAATDSYRLGVRELAITGGPAESRQVVLPSRTLAELERALGGSGTVKTVVKDNLVSFTISEGSEAGLNDAVIGSRFIEGEFPKYRQLLPDTYPNTLTVDKDALLDVTKRVGLLAQNNLPLKLRLGNELEISAHTPDVGEGQEVLDATYEGEPLVIAFNPQFLYDGVSAVQGDTVVMLVGDGLKPAILRGQKDDSFTYLLMPVRLS
jgi:DNA polymerase-3 subunit beta